MRGTATHSRRLRALLVAAVSLPWLAPGAVAAQEPLRLESLDIALWPEYDRPATLVILRSFLPATASLPATVSLPIPTSVAEPAAVAKRAADGTLLLAPYTLEDQGEWHRVRIETDRPEVRLEYYASLHSEGTHRHFVFEWPGGLTIDRVGYEVQEPRGAIELDLTPEPGQQRQGHDGLTYHFADLGPLEAGDRFFIGVSYTRTREQLSAPARPAPPPPRTAPPPRGPAPASGGTSWWVLAGAILLGGGTVYLVLAVAGRRS